MKKQNSNSSRVDSGIFLLSVGLIIFGLIAVLSASSVISYERFGHNNYYFYRQLIFGSLGILLIFVFSKIDYNFWKRWNRPLLLIGIAALALVLLPSIGFKPSTARSWFRVGTFLLQPSEFAKIFLIFYLASWFERKKDSGSNFWFGLLPPLIVTGIIIGLIVIEPDLGTASIVALIAFTIFFAVGVKLRYLAALAVAGVFGLWAMIKIFPSRAARIVTFLDPSLDPRGIGYHINQALLAIGSGGFWGYGYGKSLQKHNYLPEPIGDSIFAVMAEELGFVRIIFLVLAFTLLVILGLKVAKRAPDKFGQLTAVGIVAWIGLQAFINMAAISNLMPLTGITLPFISHGGSSLISVSIAIGVLLNISRHKI